jgi:hypothetical protein
MHLLALYSSHSSSTTHQRSFKRIQAPPQPSLCIRSIKSTLHNFPLSSIPQKFQNTTQLIASGCLLSNFELKLVHLGGAVIVVRARLILCGGRFGRGVCLFEQGEYTGRGGVVGLVEEGYCVLHAVLERKLVLED